MRPAVLESIKRQIVLSLPLLAGTSNMEPPLTRSACFSSGSQVAIRRSICFVSLAF